MDPPDLVARIGRLRQTAGRFALLFHDTQSSRRLGISSDRAIAAVGTTTPC